MKVLKIFTFCLRNRPCSINILLLCYTVYVQIYLDYAADAPIRDVAIRAMGAEWKNAGNASQFHASGRHKAKVLSTAKRDLADLLECSEHQIVLTSGGTEANNLAIKGVWDGQFDSSSAKKRNRIVLSAVEHPSVIESAKYLAETRGALIDFLPVDAHGIIDLTALEKALNDDVLLVSVQTVNNETGAIQPVCAAASLSHSAGALFHTDAIQAFTHLPVKLANNIDFISLSSHKIGGPEGIGALVVRNRKLLHAQMSGGGQELGSRSGTESPVLATGFAVAAKDAHASMHNENSRYFAFYKTITDWIKSHDAMRLNSPTALNNFAVPNIINFSIKNLDSESLLFMLDEQEVSVSIGSACHAGVQRVSHVIDAMRVPDEWRKGQIRVSFGHATTSDDIAALIKAAEQAVL
jgi:cysteine desulfurase